MLTPGSSCSGLHWRHIRCLKGDGGIRCASQRSQSGFRFNSGRRVTLPRPLIEAAILVACFGGCSLPATGGVLKTISQDNQQNQSTVTQVSFGTPVEVELLQDLDESAMSQNVRLRVRKSVWADDFIVIEEGAEAAGTILIKTPEIGTDGEVTLLAKSATSVTGAQIPIAGRYTVTGSVDCPLYWDCLRYIWTRGESARMLKGAHFQAGVVQSVELSNDTLQAFMNAKFAATHQAIARCEHFTTVRVYLLAEDAERAKEVLQGGARKKVNPEEHAPKVFWDGKEAGRVPTSTVLTLVPSSGNHIISTNGNSLVLDLARCTPYYVRILRLSPGRNARFALKLVGPERGEDETRELEEVMNHQ